MGKKRIAVISEEPTTKPVKKAKKETKTETLSKTEKVIVVKKEKKSGSSRAKSRGKKYLQAKQKVDRNKFYPLSEAIKILKSISISHFNGSVDIHLNLQKTGIKGEVTFPHPTGKSQNVRVADEALIEELKKGNVNFTVLVTSPKMMPKLLPFAKLLGPRGLMPNPKAGTISEKPQDLIKQLADKIQFRTETKFPLFHLTIGKIDSPEKNLEENFTALIRAVGKENIQKAVICPTMGPGIKIDLTALH